MKARRDDHVIVAVHVTNRTKHAGTVQSTLTKYGANIRTRVGLHETAGRKPSPNGLILLEMVGSKRRAAAMVAELNAIAGVEAKTITFEH